MNSSSTPSADEVRALADALYDGRTDDAQMKRLESLILGDLSCLQTYIQHINFHGVLSQMARNRTPEESAVAVLQDFSRAVRIREHRERRIWRAVITGFLLSTCTIIATIVVPSFLPGKPVGAISSFSAELDTQRELSISGRTIRERETIAIKEGILTLNLPHAVVDVLGPAKFRIDGPDGIYLNSGSLFTKVRDEFSGFHVRTPTVDVVDFGTEFLVSHSNEEGTQVSVRQGRVQASAINWRGEALQKLDLADHCAAVFPRGKVPAREIAFQPELFAPVDTSRGGIMSIDGPLRTMRFQPRSYLLGEVPTHNYILIVPEQQRLKLEKPLNVTSTEGPLTIPAGTVISSYLVHYDPPADLSRAPRGSVEFSEKVMCVIAHTEDLQITDSPLAKPGQVFESGAYRGLELGPDEDRAQISEDRRTISFHFDMSPPHHLDEARVITIHTP